MKLIVLHVIYKEWVEEGGIAVYSRGKNPEKESICFRHTAGQNGRGPTLFRRPPAQFCLLFCFPLSFLIQNGEKIKRSKKTRGQ